MFDALRSRFSRLLRLVPRYIAASLLVLFGGVVACPPGGIPPVPKATGPRVTPYIRGYLAIGAAGKVGERMASFGVTDSIIFVPGVRVSLVDSATNVVKDTFTTDLSGRFTFWGVKPGAYRVCWKARGFRSDCFAGVLPIADRPINLRWFSIAVERRESTTVLFGHVDMRSGATRTFEPSIGVNAFTRVFLVDLNGKALDSVYVNNHGDYILPLVPASQMLRVEGRLEGARAVRTMVAEFLSSAGAHRVDLTFFNYAPRFRDFLAASGGKRVRTAATGATIALTAQATDADGDPVSYRWRVPQGGGALSSPTGSTITWTLPSKPGLYRADVVASDGRGGYAKQYALVSTTGQGVAFSGLVNATDAPAVGQAEVEVNGVTALTNTAGRFLVRVPEDDRYVVNVRKTGYKLLSQIYQDALEGGTWTLARGTVRTVDPTQPIDVVDDRKYQRCGTVLTRVSPEQAARARQAMYEDSSGYVVRVQERRDSLPREQGCGPGLRVQIPSNGLVDATGNPPTGPVDVTVYTTDLRTPFDMPGDYTVVDAGQSKVMESYGAGHIEVRAGATRYSLRPGTTATLTLPIDPSQLAAPGAKPATIPLLLYDEKQGVWVPEGTMQRVGNAYVAPIRHFSDFNSDMVKVNQACLRIFSGDPGGGLTPLPAQYNIEITVPQGTSAPRFFSRLVANTDPFYHAFYNLPTNTDVTLLVYSTDPPPNTIVYGTFVANTGGVQNPATPNRPAPNYGACQGAVVLFDASEPVPGTDAFLHGIYSFEAANLTELQVSDPALAGQFDAASANYYQQVDPRGLRTTYSAFLGKHTFAAGNHDSATYVNAADLAFGREMHCKRTPATDGLDDDIACYVTNYGTANGSNADDDADFTNAANRTGAFATVAMEYSRVENPPGDPNEFDPADHDRVVKFYVYAQPSGTLVNKADLDGRGFRPVPQLCMVCHGGEYPNGFGLGVPLFNNKASVKMGSVFIPFDLHAFHIVDGVVVNGATPYDKANQQAAFKALNQTHVLGTHPGAAISEIIDSMYNPPTVATQSEAFVVQGWRGNAGQQAMYANVVGVSCRMCHSSRPEPAVAPFGLDLRFNQASTFIGLGPTVPLRVCIQRVMPHAYATYNRFWQSVNPHQPGQLKAFGDAQVPGGYGPNCVTARGVIPVPPGVVYFATDVQPILTANCVPCHGNAVARAGLNMESGAFGNLVNHPATELASMFRITPGDPAHSYLIHKINGTQASVGGSGARMPLGGSLFPNEIQIITKWVQDGAVP
jgi:hypothetical protein